MDDRSPPCGHEHLAPSRAFALLDTRTADVRETERRPESADGERARSVPPARFLIGLLSCLHPVSNPEHSIFQRLLSGIRIRLIANGCDLLFSATRTATDDDSFRAIAVERMIERRVDALIAWGMSTRGPEVAPILASGLPAVFIDNDVIGKRVGYVMSSNVEGMAQAVRHLYDIGRRRIAHIAGNLNTRPGPDRLLGYRSELGELGIPVSPEYVEQGDFFHQSGYEAAKRLLALETPPDAITAASDAMAIGVMVAVQEAGLRIPEDIAVTGFDDIDLAAAVFPPLTTVRQNATGMGAAAAEGVLRMLEQPDAPPPVIVVPTELIVRGSSDVAKLVL